MMKMKLVMATVTAALLASGCGGKATGTTTPHGGTKARAPMKKAAQVKGRTKGKKKVTHVVAIPKAKKGEPTPKPVRVPVAADGSYVLDIYYGYGWVIAYEADGRKVGVASYKTKGGKPSSTFNLTSNTTIVNQVFDLGVYVESNDYYFVVEHAPWEYYDTDGDGQVDALDLDDDNDGTPDDADADDDGDGWDDGDADFDLDNDGQLDFFDADDDNDGTPDEQDQDDDGDGVADAQDDDDDDGDADDDGVADDFDNDDDNDGTPDDQDQDDDGDGVADAQDDDTDGGGGGGDDDADNDGTPDSQDNDDDNDGTPDNQDNDDDNDGRPDDQGGAADSDDNN